MTVVTHTVSESDGHYCRTNSQGLQKYSGYPGTRGTRVWIGTYSVPGTQINPEGVGLTSHESHESSWASIFLAFTITSISITDESTSSTDENTAVKWHLPLQPFNPPYFTLFHARSLAPVPSCH
eukprot:2907945-Rhodomonas_salina.1